MAGNLIDVHIKIPVETKAAYEQTAKESGISFSDLVRAVLLAAVDAKVQIVVHNDKVVYSQ